MAETAPTSFYFLPKHPSPGRENREQESISQEVRDAEPDGAFSWLTSWFGGRRGYRSIESKMRKVPTKVEPKVGQKAKLNWLPYTVPLTTLLLPTLFLPTLFQGLFRE